MTYKVNNSIVINANGTIDWHNVYITGIYYGTSATRQVANNTLGSPAYGYKTESANATSIRLVCTTYNCDCNCDCDCIGTCFYGSALVTMADKSKKQLRDIQVNDEVLGAFGEINKVIALDRTFLGKRKMVRINNEHRTSEEHPHLGYDLDDKLVFFVPQIETLMLEWGQKHYVINEFGQLEQRLNRGLTSDRLRSMIVGNTLLKTDGKKEISDLFWYSEHPATPLYNLVVSGSHTYYVDDYCVTGWPREDDFDYDNWKQIKESTLGDY